MARQHKNHHTSKSGIMDVEHCSPAKTRQVPMPRSFTAKERQTPATGATASGYDAVRGLKARMDVMITIFWRGPLPSEPQTPLQPARCRLQRPTVAERCHREKDAAQVLRELGNGSIQPRCDEVNQRFRQYLADHDENYCSQQNGPKNRISEAKACLSPHSSRTCE